MKRKYLQDKPKEPQVVVILTYRGAIKQQFLEIPWRDIKESSALAYWFESKANFSAVIKLVYRPVPAFASVGCYNVPDKEIPEWLKQCKGQVVIKG